VVDQPVVLSADKFRYWAVDFTRNEYEVVTADGQRLTGSVPHPWPHSEVTRSVFDWEHWRVISTTSRGDTIVSQAYNPHHTHPGRPSVYLDQNHWSTLAWARVDPSRVRDEDELAAALRIINLAQDATIVLPLSSAHFIETYPLYGDRRYNLGVAMAQLSAGWTLRSPMAVWDNEVAVMLARHEHQPLPTFSQLPVVTTEPQAFLINGQHAYEAASDAELLLLVLSEPSVALSCLLDVAPQAKPATPEWVERNQQLTEYFAEAGLSSAEHRLQAMGFFWTDNIQVLVKAAATVGVDPTSFARDGDELLRQTESMPFLSLLSALLRLRYLDRQRRWEANDLVDMMYLSCAAAYCDYVVAERYTGTQLRQIQDSRGARSNTFLKLSELVSTLERDGVGTGTEQLGA
jgi:hypothetical protein